MTRPDYGGKFGSLRNLNGYLESIANWTPVNSCLPESAGVMDIDGVLERRGNFLYLENKAAGAQIPAGQYISYAQSVLQGHMVFFVFGTVEAPAYIRVMYRDSEKGTVTLGEPAPITLPELQKKITRWWDWATQHPHKSYRRVNIPSNLSAIPTWYNRAG